jgi:tRNA (mo5U34)-methyltransferase
MPAMDRNADIGAIDERARRFGEMLAAKKNALAPPDFAWYPYGTLSNFFLFTKLLRGDSRKLFELIGDGRFVDIGTADGDTAFFLESCGFRGVVIDYPPTNYNSCRGLRLLHGALGSAIEIQEFDFDRAAWQPGEQYALAFFLGILYHLKNPFLALESLARNCRHALLSTRIARYNVAHAAVGTQGAVNASRVELRGIPAAYLVAPDETNNDATNYWMFSEAGLRRILDRSGWDVVNWMTCGNTVDSDPATEQGDERAFALLRSRHGDAAA